MNDDAMNLLRAMNNHQAKGQEGALMNPYEVASQVGLEPGTWRYKRAVNELEAKEAMEEDEWASAQQVDTTFYRMTRTGLDMLGL